MSVRGLVALAALTAATHVAAAQTPASAPVDSAAIQVAVITALEAEQQAFETRDCETSVSYFADLQPLFVVSGRVMPSRAILSMACGQMVAARSGEARQLERHVVHVLSATSAFSVSVYRVPASEGPASASAMRQVVTKIWLLQDGRWRIGHLHESSGPLTPLGPPGRSRPPA